MDGYPPPPPRLTRAVRGVQHLRGQHEALHQRPVAEAALGVQHLMRGNVRACVCVCASVCASVRGSVAMSVFVSVRSPASRRSELKGVGGREGDAAAFTAGKEWGALRRDRLTA